MPMARRLPFQPGQTKIDARPRHVTALPSGYNHHWTKSMVASPDGKYLFVGVGSNSNVGENGMEMEKGRAAVWMIDASDRRLSNLRQRPAQPGRDRLEPVERNSGRWSTSATNSATISSPII